MKIEQIDFSKYSSIKIGQIEDVLMIEDGDTIPSNRYLIGGANNILLSPTPPPLMMLSKDFSYIDFSDGILECGAATMTGRLLSFAKRHNLGGLEYIAKLPGTVGGLVAMNAGVKEYETFNILDSIEIDGRWIDKSSIEYGYRYAKLPGIVTRARFRLKSGFDNSLAKQLLKLRDNQPKEPNAGSVFKNPDGDFAGRLIEAVGLKGYRVGNMALSSIHANFLVNLGGGQYSEAMELIELAKDRVYNQFGIELKEEIKII